MKFPENCGVLALKYYGIRTLEIMLKCDPGYSEKGSERRTHHEEDLLGLMKIALELYVLRMKQDERNYKGRREQLTITTEK